MRAVAPAVQRRSSSLIKHVASAAASATGSAGNTGAGAPAGAAGAGGAGDHRRNRLLNVAMRSKTAAAAVEGSNYEDEVGLPNRRLGVALCHALVGGALPPFVPEKGTKVPLVCGR